MSIGFDSLGGELLTFDSYFLLSVHFDLVGTDLGLSCGLGKSGLNSIRISLTCS